MHTALIATAAVCFGVAWSMPDPSSSFVLIVAVLAIWYTVSRTSVQVLRRMPLIAAAVDRDPVAAEMAIAAALRRRPIQRPIRLLLYHRLALTRHRQQRYAEAAAIATALLTQPAGWLRAVERVDAVALSGRARRIGSGQITASLLLVMVDCRLRCADLGGAYAGLIQLHTMRLSVADLLQRLVLQTRYELAAGHAGAVLDGIEKKLSLFELLPADQCGVMHGMLSVAAAAQGRASLAEWLKERAGLLCTPKRYAEIMARVSVEA